MKSFRHDQITKKKKKLIKKFFPPLERNFLFHPHTVFVISRGKVGILFTFGDISRTCCYAAWLGKLSSCLETARKIQISFEKEKPKSGLKTKAKTSEKFLQYVTMLKT